MKRGVVTLMLVVLMQTSAVCRAAPPGPRAPAPLVATAVAQLLDPAQGSRVIALWSLECTYCEENLRALMRLHAAHPAIDLVLVSTDPIARSADIARRLAAIGAGALPTYAYADPMPQRLDMLLDPGWGGELPRTLAVAAGHRRAWSGALHADSLQEIVDFAIGPTRGDR